MPATAQGAGRAMARGSAGEGMFVVSACVLSVGGDMLLAGSPRLQFLNVGGAPGPVWIFRRDCGF